MIGQATAALAKDWFGVVTIPIYDKHFDPDRVLMDHRHNIKWEYYNFDPLNKQKTPSRLPAITPRPSATTPG